MTEREPSRRPEPHPCPPHRRARWHPLVIPGERYPIHCRFLCERLEGRLLHYVANTAVPHFRLCQQPQDCSCCRLGHPCYWYGYAAVQEVYRGRVCLLAVTQAAYQHCDRLHELQGRLRGWRLSAWRLVSSRCGPVRVQLEEPLAAAAPLPEPF